MSKISWQVLAILSSTLLLGACTNGGKNVRDTTGMTPGATADSVTSRRDTLGGRMRRLIPGAAHDSMQRMQRMMRDTTRRP